MKSGLSSPRQKPTGSRVISSCGPSAAGGRQDHVIIFNRRTTSPRTVGSIPDPHNPADLDFDRRFAESDAVRNKAGPGAPVSATAGVQPPRPRANCGAPGSALRSHLPTATEHSARIAAFSATVQRCRRGVQLAYYEARQPHLVRKAASADRGHWRARGRTPRRFCRFCGVVD